MRKLFIFLALLLMPSIVLAQSYYADIEISVNENGVAVITGLTNHPQLMIGETEEYTSKEGRYWMLNVTFNEVFDYYTYKVTLPKGAVINYLKTPASVSISEEAGQISLASIGNNETFYVIMQYSIKREFFDYYLLLIPIITFCAVLIVLVIKKRGLLNKKKKIDYSLLTEREALIIKLIKKKGRVNQKTLVKELKIPKSSISRNINSLIRKELIIKQKKGFSNIIMIKE